MLEAADGAEAVRIARARAGRIDLLVTDVVMPGLGGHALGERLRALRPALRVLLRERLHRRRVVRHGSSVNPSTAVLQKPFTPEALARQVREVLDG